MKKIKVLHINESLCIGGRENMILEFCNHLNYNKFDVSLLTLDKDLTLKDKLNNHISLLNLNYKRNDLKALNLFFKHITFIRQIGNILKKGKYDIIHLHSYASIHFFISIAIFLYAKNVPVVKTIHTSGLHYASNSLSNKFRRLLEIVATKMCKTHLIAISQTVYTKAILYFNKYAQSINLIYNGKDLNPFKKDCPNILKKEESDIIGIYSARIVNGKNHMFLINIWKVLKERGKNNIKLYLAGDGDNLTFLKKYINKEGLSDSIICLGYCNNVPEILLQSDFAVFPSEYEGFSIALIEKLAAGLPVICSKIPPFEEVINNNHNGFIIDIKNKKAWIDCIEKISMNKKLRERIGFNAKLKSEDFSIEKMINKYEILYSEIVFNNQITTYRK